MPEVITSPAPLVGYHPPWTRPEMPPESDLGATIVNAFAKGAETNRRRQQMEGQLERLALQNERLQMQNAWKDKEYQYKYDALALRDEYQQQGLAIRGDQLDLANQRLAWQKEHGGDMYDLAALRADQSERALSSKIDKEKSAAENAALAQDLLDQNPHPPGTMAHRAYVSDARLQIPYSTATKSIFDAADRENENAARAVSHDMDKDFTHVKQMTDMVSKSKGIPEEALHWPESMWGKGKGPEGEDSRYIVRELTPPDEKGNQSVKWYLTPKDEAELVAAKKRGDKAAQARILDYKTIDAGTYDTIHQGWGRINKRASNPLGMPAPVDNYETIPANPADRVPNKIYNSKAGLVKWDGTNAIRVNQ